MNFGQKYDSYEQEAVVQQQVAKELLQFLVKQNSAKEYRNALEIGCGTGMFTRLFVEQYPVKHFIANDIFDTKSYVQHLSSVEFQQGDIETLELPNRDIVVSSSALQWIKDFEALMYKIANTTDEVAFSMYVKGNLQEINDHFNNSLPYRESREIADILGKHFAEVDYYEKVITKSFSSPMAALKHLSDTGVTGSEFKKASIKAIRSYKSTTLTYKVGYFYGKK